MNASAEATTETATDVAPADLLAASAEVEARLSQEEEIERRTAGTHAETPHFRKEVD